jgi:hypothetical protein
MFVRVREITLEEEDIVRWHWRYAVEVVESVQLRHWAANADSLQRVVAFLGFLPDFTIESWDAKQRSQFWRMVRWRLSQLVLRGVITDQLTWERLAITAIAEIRSLPGYLTFATRYDAALADEHVDDHDDASALPGSEVEAIQNLLLGFDAVVLR